MHVLSEDILKSMDTIKKFFNSLNGDYENEYNTKSETERYRCSSTDF